MWVFVGVEGVGVAGVGVGVGVGEGGWVVGGWGWGLCAGCRGGGVLMSRLEPACLHIPHTVQGGRQAGWAGHWGGGGGGARTVFWAFKKWGHGEKKGHKFFF